MILVSVLTTEKTEKLTFILNVERKSNDKDNSKINFRRFTRIDARETKGRIFGQSLTDN